MNREITNSNSNIAQPRTQLRSSIWDVVRSVDDDAALQSMYDYVLYVAQKTSRQAATNIQDDMEELLAAFRTDKISPDDIDKECEAVRQEMYDRHRQM